MRLAQLGSGGITFAIDGSSFASIDAVMPCAAWMVPMVPDEATPAPLMWEHHRTDLDVGSGVQLSLSVGTLVPCSHSNGMCVVKTIRGTEYAVLKRGLLTRGCTTVDAVAL